MRAREAGRDGGTAQAVPRFRALAFISVLRPCPAAMLPRCRSGLFIIAPDGTLRQKTVNDLPVGRSVDETLRLVKAFQVREASRRRSACAHAARLQWGGACWSSAVVCSGSTSDVERCAHARWQCGWLRSVHSSLLTRLLPAAAAACA